MSEIKKLLESLGISTEGVASITEALAAWEKSVRTAADKQLQERLEKAKAVCLEEVNQEKQRLARLTEVFLESRSNTVTKEAQRQAAIGESESSKTLREMKALLEGVKLENVPEEYQAAVAEMKRLRVKLHESLEANKGLTAKYQRVTGIASRTLKYAKMLESKLPKPAVSEGEKNKRPAAKNLEQLRESEAKPKTTRRTLTESQVPAKKNRQQVGDPTVMEIAGQIDDTPGI